MSIRAKFFPGEFPFYRSRMVKLYAWMNIGAFEMTLRYRSPNRSFASWWTSEQTTTDTGNESGRLKDGLAL
ncbi:hypothetical protein FMEAI12_5940006 [Parafrankia sp. Ea1.12]|nr:hypothetical protein FMEAI12_5940006 [Parafrankia sp. Ea1.12]